MAKSKRVRTRFSSDDIQYVPASALVRNPRNWRTHPTDQSAAVRTAISRNGFVQPLLVRAVDDHYELIDGELRANISGEDEVPVIVLDLSQQEADEVLLALDATAAMAGVNPDNLDHLLASTGLASIDGYSELAASLASDLEMFRSDLFPTGDAEDEVDHLNRVEECRVTIDIDTQDKDGVKEALEQVLRDLGVGYSINVGSRFRFVGGDV